MNSQKRKMATLFLWGGAVLIVVGIALSYARLIPFVQTTFYSEQIPTAPPLLLSSESTPDVLMPWGTGDEVEDVTPTPDEPPATMPAVESPPTNTPTVTLSPTETPTATDTVPLDTATPEPTMTPVPTQTPAPTATPAPTVEPSPALVGVEPARVRIPAIQLDAPVVSIGWTVERIDGQNQAIWDVPNWHAAGWHNTSARLGVPGNTVFNGHNTLNGEVFRDLYRLDIGAIIYVDGENGETYAYQIGEKYIVREAGQPLSVRLENARYIQETPDERLTLVTCHPYGSLRNRLLVIAYPVESGQAQ